MDKIQFLIGSDSPARHRLAYHHVNPGAASTGRPGVLWLGGFGSDMEGSKALALDDWARRTGREYVRFDYSGHGASDGAFVDGSITDWTDDALAVFEKVTSGPVILVGSSMGGWIACLLARRHREAITSAPGQGNRIAGMVLIAPALDFTEDLMWATMTPAVRQEILDTGRHEQPSDYSDEPCIITRRLIKDGRSNCLLGGPIETGCPVRILQGQRDTDVPWSHAMKIIERLVHDDVTLTLVKDGDHRLSTDADLERMITAVEQVA